MSRATYKQHSLGAPPLRAEGGTRWWSMAVVSFVLCAGPTGAQTRVHNPRAPKPAPAPTKPAPAPTKPAPPANSTAPGNPTTAPAKPAPPATPTPPANSVPPAGATPTPPANPAPPAGATPSTPKPPASSTAPTPAPRPPAPAPPAADAGAAIASDAMRGLLVGLDLHHPSITLARNAYPPLTLPLSSGAAITRDGAPAQLGDLEIGSSTVIPDFVLVNTVGGAGGTLVVSRIKATSRDHYWYGHLTSIDPSTLTIGVTRADGQRRSFHLNDRTNVLEFGRGNVAWSALHVGGIVEVVWIPGNSDDSTSVREAHSVVLDKPYEGILRRAPLGH